MIEYEVNVEITVKVTADSPEDAAAKIAERLGYVAENPPMIVSVATIGEPESG